MDILIYGAGKMGKTAFELMKNSYKTKCVIKGFVDQNKCGEYQGIPICRLEDIGSFNGRVIIALFDFEIAKSVCKTLQVREYTDMFWFQDKKDG